MKIGLSLNMVLTSLLLALSLNSLASRCPDILSKDFLNKKKPPFPHQNYTPSSVFLEGEALALKVINHRNQYGQSSDSHPLSLWLEFQNDDRYDGPFAKNPKNALDVAFKYLEHHYYRLVDDTLVKIIIENCRFNFTHCPLFFITWKPLGIRAMNLLLSHRIYPLGLIKKIQYADGLKMSPIEFFEHDLEHATNTELMIYPQTHNREAMDPFIQLFHQRFNYTSLREKLPPDHQLLFDLAYFIYFHEGIDVNKADAVSKKLIELKKKSPSLHNKDLQEIYKHTWFENELIFDFRPNNKVFVFNKIYKSYYWMRRFLNREDLWNHLPIEIQREIEESPTREQKEKILKPFINRLLTVFFNQHYQIAKEVLGIQ